MIPWQKLSLGEEIYTHVDEQNVTRHFAIKRLNDWLPSSGLKTMWNTITEEDVHCALTNRGVEMPRVISMEPSWRDKPVVCAEWRLFGKGVVGVITLDGNHRFVRRYLDGFRNIEMYLVPRKAWEKFCVAGLPDTTHERIRNAPPVAEATARHGVAFER